MPLAGAVTPVQHIPTADALPGRRRGRVAVIACLLVLLLGVGTDQVLRRVVEHRIAAALSCRLGTTGVSVHLSGLLVAPHLLTGRVGTVVVDGSASPPADPSARRRVQITLHDVRAQPLSGGSVTSGPGELDVTVPFVDLTPPTAGAAQSNGADPPRLGSAGDQMTLTRAAPVLGTDVVVLLDLTLDGVTVVATPTTVEVAGRQLPVAAADSVLRTRNPALADQLAPRRVPLPPLPAGATATRVHASTAGIVLSAALPAQDLAGDAPCAA